MLFSEKPAENAPSDSTSPNITRELAVGSGWMIGAQLAIQAIGLLSTIILARLLIPADFGLVALAITIFAGLQALSDLSFDVPLIQNPRAGRAEYDTAWTLSACRDILIAIGLTVAAEPIASGFEDPRLGPIIYCLAIATFLDGIQNIGIVDFRKELKFHQDLIFRVLGKLGPFLVTIPLAFLWRNYWALVIGTVAGSLFRLILSFAMHSYRPRVSFTEWRGLLQFSKWLMLANLCIFISSRAITFIISAISGTGALGVFLISTEIAYQVNSNLLAPMRRALFPGYSKVAADLGRLQFIFLDISALVFLIGTPLTLGIGLVANPLVKVALGPNWIEAIPLIKILSIKEFLLLTSSMLGPIYLATGHPRYTMALQSFNAIVTLPLLILGTFWAGLVGAAYATLVAAASGVIFDLFLGLPLLSLSIFTLLAAIWRPLVAGAMMFAVVSMLEAYWQADSVAGSMFLLVIYVTAGAATYSAGVFFLWVTAGLPRGAESHLITLLKGGLRLVAGRMHYMCPMRR